MLLANVQSLDNKPCKLTETWLLADVLDQAIESPDLFAHCSNRDEGFSGKKRGGGVCLMVDRASCDQRNIGIDGTFCSSDRE